MVLYQVHTHSTFAVKREREVQSKASERPSRNAPVILF